MKSRLHNLEKYQFTDKDLLLLDANIWITLFPGPSNPEAYTFSSYREAFKKIVESKAKILMDPLVLCEYVNKYSKIEYNALFTGKYKNFKLFRKSTDFTDTAAGAMLFTKKIIGLTSLIDAKYSDYNFQELSSMYESGNLDFNDGIIAESCKLNGCKLVTHDRDFSECEIDIITANTKWLSK